jgi:hypothetical protein
MAGVLVFRSLRVALDAGFQVYDRAPNGFIVRRKGEKGWELAIVELIPQA